MNALGSGFKSVFRLGLFITLFVTTAGSRTLRAEPPPADDTPYSNDIESKSPPPAPLPPEKTGNSDTPPPARGQRSNKRDSKDPRNRKYFIPDTDRTDAGIFHVAFAAGGNFYLEPKLDSASRLSTGDYFLDFGFQGGVYFDYDYSALTENVPLSIRGMVGYKYILNSTNVFAFDGVVRYMFRISDYSSFGLGIGTSAAVWYRAQTTTSDQEVIFLPSFIINGGFDFNPFMVDIKWLMTRIGQNATIMGWELYFGVRL